MENGSEKKMELGRAGPDPAEASADLARERDGPAQHGAARAPARGIGPRRAG